MSTSFQVGDHVRVPMGRQKVSGIISLDRGSVGINGRHLFQVLIPADPFKPTPFEFAEDEIEQDPKPVGLAPPIDQVEIIPYLKNGGLVAILQANLGSGPNPPQVWLCRNSLGALTHTFIQERGLIGGASVPPWAVEGVRIFVPKRGEVAQFLASFGLDAAQAEDVIQAVGLDPR